MKTLPSLLFYLFVAYTLLLVMPVSLMGTMPYLDSSWGYDINYYLHSRFNFGADLVFTYGPLGFLNNPGHVGQDIPIAFVVHILFLLALGAQLVSIWRSGKQAAAAILCISLALGHRLYYDYFDFGLAALSLITVFKLLRQRPNYLDLILVPLLAGVSLLVKFTGFAMIAAMLFIYAVHLVLGKAVSKRQAIWLASCFLSAPAAYLIYDLSVVHLAQYVRGSLEIASGFATAMSTPSSGKDRTLALLLVLIIAPNLIIGLWRRRLLWSELMLIALIGWIAFRQGFVRGEGNHPAMFFAFALLFLACLWLSTQAKPGAPEVVLALSSLAFVATALIGVAERYPVLAASNFWPQSALNELRLLKAWDSSVYSMDHGSDAAFAALPGMPFRKAIENKRVMIFPNANPYVVKINFEMFPIYSLQAYAAFTAYLDYMCARSLIRAKPRVDKVLVEWAAIDGRNQMLDTPALSMALFSSFTRESRAPGALLLAHRATDLPIHLATIDHQPFAPDVWVTVPLSDHLVAMSIRLKQTLMGTLVTNLFDQDAVYMELATRSGPAMRYRVPPLTLRNPGLINFVPQSLDELEKLWMPEALQNRVVGIRLTGPGTRYTISKGYDFYEVQNAGVRFIN